MKHLATIFALLFFSVLSFAQSKTTDLKDEQIARQKLEVRSGGILKVAGYEISGISNDPTLADSLNSHLVTEAAAKAYANTKDPSTTNELTTFTSASSAPSSPKTGDIWHKSTTDSVFIRTAAPAWAFLAIRASGSSDPAMGGDLSGTASNAQIVANAVGSSEIATGAVTTTEILDATVAWADLAQAVKDSINAGGGSVGGFRFSTKTVSSGTATLDSVVTFLTGTTSAVIFPDGQDGDVRWVVNERNANVSFTVHASDGYQFDDNKFIPANLTVQYVFNSTDNQWKVGNYEPLISTISFTGGYDPVVPFSLKNRDAGDIDIVAGEQMQIDTAAVAWLDLSQAVKDSINAGGSESTTATNGLSLSGSAVKLGGTLTENTAINGTYDLRFGNSTKLDSFDVYANKITFGLNGFSFLKTSGTGGGDVNENLFLGYKAGQNYSGLYGSYANTVVGKGAAALLRDTTVALAMGRSNVIIGYSAAPAATYASFNTVLGTATAGVLTTGQYNTVLGYHAGQNMGNLTGATLVGTFAGRDATNVITAIGYNASYNGGAGTTAIGQQAGENNTGSLNTFIGNLAGKGTAGSSTGIANTAIGLEAGANITTGGNNTMISRYAGRAVTTGSRNTYIGNNACETCTTGNDNIAIGYARTLSSNTASGELNIGDVMFGTGITSLSTRRAGINISNPATTWDILSHITTNNAIAYPLRVRGNTTTGAMQPGFGAGIEFTVPNRTGVATITGNMATVVTDSTNASIDADLIFGNVVSGTLANRMWLRGQRIGLGAAPVASAALDVNSTTAGFLQPRMTTTQRNAISTPATGLQVYNNSLNKLNYYDGSTWRTVLDSTLAESTYWRLSGRVSSSNSDIHVVTADSATVSSVNTILSASTNIYLNPTGELILGNGSGANLPTTNSGHLGMDLGYDGTGVAVGSQKAAKRSLVGTSNPVDGTTVAWYAGQLYTNSATGSQWVATTASSNPDLSGTGSVWSVVGGLRASATLDFIDTPPGECSNLTITVTGAADSDPVALAVPTASMPANGSFSAYVSGTNTVTVRYCNNQLVGNLNPASGTFKVKVFK